MQAATYRKEKDIFVCLKTCLNSWWHGRESRPSVHHPINTIPLIFGCFFLLLRIAPIPLFYVARTVSFCDLFPDVCHVYGKHNPNLSRISNCFAFLPEKLSSQPHLSTDFKVHQTEIAITLRFFSFDNSHVLVTVRKSSNYVERGPRTNASGP